MGSSEYPTKRDGSAEPDVDDAFAEHEQTPKRLLALPPRAELPQLPPWEAGPPRWEESRERTESSPPAPKPYPEALPVAVTAPSEDLPDEEPLPLLFVVAPPPEAAPLAPAGRETILPQSPPPHPPGAQPLRCLPPPRVTPPPHLAPPPLPPPRRITPLPHPSSPPRRLTPPPRRGVPTLPRPSSPPRRLTPPPPPRRVPPCPSPPARSLPPPPPPPGAWSVPQPSRPRPTAAVSSSPPPQPGVPTPRSSLRYSAESLSPATVSPLSAAPSALADAVSSPRHLHRLGLCIAAAVAGAATLAAIAALLPALAPAPSPAAQGPAESPAAAMEAVTPVPVVEPPVAAEVDSSPAPPPEPPSVVRRHATWPPRPQGEAAPAEPAEEVDGAPPQGPLADVAGEETAEDAATPSETAPANETEAAEEEEPGEAPKLDRPVAAVAAQALRAAAATAAGCGGGTAARVRVAVTFGPSGQATSAVVSHTSPIAGTSVGSCVAAHMRGASIPAFSGDPVTFLTMVTIR